MLFMVVETFKLGNADAIGERFRTKGRMMPDDLGYLASWLNEQGTICYQLMEAPSLAAFDAWTRNWSDLMDFQITPVLPSSEFWEDHGKRNARAVN